MSVRESIHHGGRVRHGSFSKETRFHIKQHHYAGGGDEYGAGYVEVLEIVDAPEDRCRFLINEWNDWNQCAMSEWATLEQAEVAFKRSWTSGPEGRNYLQLPGFKRWLTYDLSATPWFYAKEGEEIEGDLVKL